MLTRLLPSRMVPISRSVLRRRRLTSAARLSPFCSSWCIIGREAAVNAVSEPEKNADIVISKTMMARVTYMVSISRF